MMQVAFYPRPNADDCTVYWCAFCSPDDESIGVVVVRNDNGPEKAVKEIIASDLYPGGNCFIIPMTDEEWDDNCLVLDRFYSADEMQRFGFETVTLEEANNALGRRSGWGGE